MGYFFILLYIYYKFNKNYFNEYLYLFYSLVDTFFILEYLGLSKNRKLYSDFFTLFNFPDLEKSFREKSWGFSWKTIENGIIKKGISVMTGEEDPFEEKPKKIENTIIKENLEKEQVLENAEKLVKKNNSSNKMKNLYKNKK